jgi:tRNA A37 threonylcarbamoyladenosine modification protein TsaB
MIFIINTAKQEEIFSAIRKGDFLYKKKIKGRQSGKILFILDGLLKKAKEKKENLSGIIVVNGPGPFTSVRQGVVVANALGKLLNIPVLGVNADDFIFDEEFIKICEKKLKKIKPGKIVLPFYNREPNITRPK